MTTFQLGGLSTMSAMRSLHVSGTAICREDDPCWERIQAVSEAACLA